MDVLLLSEINNVCHWVILNNSQFSALLYRPREEIAVERDEAGGIDVIPETLHVHQVVQAGVAYVGTRGVAEWDLKGK